MRDYELVKIAEEIGSPSFVFNIDELRKRICSIKEILGDNINLCYSIKANPFVIPKIADYVDKFEVCSPGELEIIKYYGVSPDKIIYSGVNKGFTDVNEAYEYGAAVITAESKRHFDIIKKLVSEKGKPVSVILRLSSGNQFGMSREDIKSILDGMPYDNISIDGIHYFAGTQRNNPKPQEKELISLAEFIKELREEYHIPLEKIEYGPGLPHPYFTKDDFSDTLQPLKNVAGCLKETSLMGELTVEMGRFIASGCGYYLSGIADIKHRDEQNWCICDGGMNHVNYYGQMMGMKCPVIRHLKYSSSESQNFDNREEVSYALCGSLCTANDILVKDLRLKGAEIGDLLVFENLGAYSVTEGINLFLSRDMAKVALYEEGKLKLVRDKINTWKLNCDLSMKLS